MSCQDVRRYIDAFVDGELQAGALLELETHLSSCDGCRALVALRRGLKAQLRRLGETRAPKELRDKVQRIVSGHTRRRRIALFSALPIAAAAALALVLVRPWASAPSSELLSEVVEDVVQRHARDLPMEVTSADPAAAASWFEGKVDFPVRASSLGLENASFGGARLSNVRTHQAAHMRYLVDGHRVSLMIFNSEHVDLSGGTMVDLGPRKALIGRRNGFNVAIVLDNDMAYALSSDLPAERLLQLARNL